jgi:hypothetical protein
MLPDKMKQYQLTINLSFQPHDCDVEEEIEYNEDGEEMKSESLNPEDKAKLEAFQRTDQYYAKNSVIDHIKRNSAFGMVEYLPCDGEVLSAKWDPKKFAIHMVVNTNQTEEELRDDVKSNSLEDGEYEGCGDTGWIVMTRGPKNEVFGPPFDLNDYWEYGLTDYRDNPVEIKLLGEISEMPECDKLFTLTEEAQQLYEAISEARKRGMQLNDDDMKKFWLMTQLKKDNRLYPVGRV